MSSLSEFRIKHETSPTPPTDSYKSPSSYGSKGAAALALGSKLENSICSLDSSHRQMYEKNNAQMSASAALHQIMQSTTVSSSLPHVVQIA